MESRSTSRDLSIDLPFDPGRDGFGFRNPSRRSAAGGLRGRADDLLYGNGLCFGMAVLSLVRYEARRAGDTPDGPLSGRSWDDALGGELKLWHRRQFHPLPVAATVRYWVGSLGGRPEYAPARLRPAGMDDPHILCFGPRPNLRALRCLGSAHAVVPYRVEREPRLRRVYVYDPNYPGDRSRSIAFYRNGEHFEYGGFNSWEGWGVTLVPLSAVLGSDGRFRLSGSR